MTEPPLPPEDDNELESSLERGLRRQPLSPEALERMRLHVLAEFRRRHGVRSAPRRHGRWWALAAAVSVLAVGAVLFTSFLTGNTVVAQLESSSGGGVLMPVEGAAQQPVRIGGQLHALERWNVRGPIRAKLAARGTLRMSEGALVGALEPDSIVLDSGRAYFDFPPGSAPFFIQTSLGVIEHVGTQFEVTQSDRGVRVRVREGSVILRGSGQDVSIDKGMELLVERNGRVERSASPTYGDDWAWVEAMAPPYDIENRRLSDFLSWVARETGRQVTYLDTRAHEVADRTTLHGSVQGLRPMEALDQVLSTTTLRFEVKDGEIRIALFAELRRLD